MIWGAISSTGVVDLKVIEGRQDSKGYLNLLKDAKTKISQVMGDEKWIFQQDNAAIHTANIVNKWFTKEKITCLVWPAYSPDLNIIENVWGYLSRHVYAESRQFSSKNELLDAILSECRKIPQSYIKELFKSLPNRIFDVINKNGGSTKY